MSENDTINAMYHSFTSSCVKDDNLDAANLVDTTNQMAIMIGLLADAITPSSAYPSMDANDGLVSSLTEAVMGVSAGLVRIADAITGLKDD